MDLKKLALPDYLPLRRRKFVSGLGLWVVASLTLLSLLLLTSNSLKDRVVGPLLQGFSSVRTYNSSLASSWPFAFPTSYVSPTVNRNVTNKGNEPNVVAVVLEKTHFTEKGRNGSFGDEEGFAVRYNKTHFGSFSVVVNNGSVLRSLPDAVNNGSLHGEEGSVISNSSISVTGYVNVSDVNNNTVERNQNNEVNLIHNESVGGSRLNFEKCDIFDGRWVRDDSKPYYPPGSCPHIDRDFDCHLNGRPDDGFVKWRWQPNGCDIPSLNATDFLERLRGQKLVFVGDSLNRNMWESLVCILRHSIRNKKRVYEISGRTEFKKKGFYAFMFEDYNCTVDFVASPFLVRESSFKGSDGTIETLRLDLMEKTKSMYHDADIIVFNTGHWWTHEKTSRGENYYQEGNHVYTRLKVLEAYKRALLTWARWVDKNIITNRTQIFFRGYSVTHFRGGQWNSGGQCHKETEPIFNPAYLAKYPPKMKVFQSVLQEMKTPVTYLNISRLTDYRKDAHPSIYRMKYKTEEERIAAERAQDCSHWCLPGVPDTWNELLYASLLKVGRGSWRS